MDFIFALVVKLLLAELFPLIISYDTACQWFIKLFQQMGAWPECLQIPGHVHVHAIILKLQFQSHHDKNHAQHCLHWMLGVGQCDCKGLEKTLGSTLKRKYLTAIVERNLHIEAHYGFMVTVPPLLVGDWEQIAVKWEEDFSFPKMALNPFEVVGEGKSSVNTYVHFFCFTNFHLFRN